MRIVNGRGEKKKRWPPEEIHVDHVNSEAAAATTTTRVVE